MLININSNITYIKFKKYKYLKFPVHWDIRNKVLELLEWANNGNLSEKKIPACKII